MSDALKASVAPYKVVSAAAQPHLANLHHFIGGQASARADVSTRAKELFGKSVASKVRRPK